MAFYLFAFLVLVALSLSLRRAITRRRWRQLNAIDGKIHAARYAGHAAIESRLLRERRTLCRKLNLTP